MKQLVIFSTIMMIFLASCAWFKSAPKEDVVVVPEPEIASDIRLTAENYVSDGIAHHRNGNDSLAVIAWKKALELIPGDAEVHNFIAIGYHKLNKLDNAIAHFTLATELDTIYYQAFNNLGYILFLQKDYAGAKESFQKALAINDQYEPAKLNYAKTQRIMSGELLREVFELSEYAERLEDVDQKIEYYQKILTLDPLYAEGHNNIAVAYWNKYLNDTTGVSDLRDSTLSHLQIALKLENDYPEALNNMGYILKVAAQYDAAIKLFLKAASLKKTYLLALNNLGETYWLNGENENAKRVFQTVLEIDPENEVARDIIAKLDQEE
jgi:tetratricopeptide (TPR) repeat protein